MAPVVPRFEIDTHAETVNDVVRSKSPASGTSIAGPLWRTVSPRPSGLPPPQTYPVPGSNAATHSLKAGDVLLAYNGRALHKRDDLQAVAEGEKLIAVQVWRDGISSRRDLAPGKLGVMPFARVVRPPI